MLPYDIQYVILEIVARSRKKALNAELVREINPSPLGRAEWATASSANTGNTDNRLTLYHSLIRGVTRETLRRQPLSASLLTERWLESIAVKTTSLDFWERTGLRCVVDAWREQERQTCYSVSTENKTFYLTSFLHVLPYQHILSLKRYFEKNWELNS